MKTLGKYILLVCLIVGFCLFPFSCFARAVSLVSVVVDGQPVRFSEDMGTPFIDTNNRTQVPLRITMEAMGAKVEWDSGVRMAIVSKGNITVRVPIGAEFVWINGEKRTNDTAAVIVNDRTYLPIRIVAEALGADVAWNRATRTVQITSHGDPAAWICTGVSVSVGSRTIGSFSYVWDENTKTLQITEQGDEEIIGYYEYLAEYECEHPWTSYGGNICYDSPMSDYVGSYYLTPNGKNTIMVKHGNSSTSFKFSERGQLTEKFSYSEKTAYSNSYQETTQYSYNYLGLMTYANIHGEELYPGEYYFDKEIWYEYNSKGDVTKILTHIHDIQSRYDFWNQSTYSYTYDQNGRVSQMIADNAPYYFVGENPTQSIHNYSYNSEGRLTEEKVTIIDDGDEYNPSTTDYDYIICSYDDHGNIVRKTYVLENDDVRNTSDGFTYSYRKI